MDKAKYWILTIPHHLFTPFLPKGILYIKGQLEQGNESGYLHWQLICILEKQSRLPAIKKIFGTSIHAEPTRSSKADEYVWKEDTRVANTQFELGKKPMCRNRITDWEEIRSAATSGQLDDIPADVYIRCYNQLRRISADNASPVAIEREVIVYWGSTGVGKSRRAWEEAGLDAFPKDPRTKFWDGYRNHQHVVIDEFRGGIDIAHILRWFDRYPVLVEIKGSATVLKANKIWITSNLPPELWYPELDDLTKQALLRRLNITHMT